jgi:hypothetical protein
MGTGANGDETYTPGFTEEGPDAVVQHLRRIGCKRGNTPA